jgi:hypothetical protein
MATSPQEMQEISEGLEKIQALNMSEESPYFFGYFWRDREIPQIIRLVYQEQVCRESKWQTGLLGTGV